MKNKIKDLLQIIYLIKYVYYINKINRIKRKSDKLTQKISLGNLVKLASKYGELL